MGPSDPFSLVSSSLFTGFLIVLALEPPSASTFIHHTGTKCLPGTTPQGLTLGIQQTQFIDILPLFIMYLLELGMPSFTCSQE